MPGIGDPLLAQSVRTQAVGRRPRLPLGIAGGDVFQRRQFFRRGEAGSDQFRRMPEGLPRLITADNRDLSFVAIMEAIKLMVAHPGQVYYMLGNHDLALNLRRELVKGGKFLNRYLFRGMAYMYRGRYEDVLEAYREFIGDMPAAIFSPNGVFMSHSTPKRAFIPTLSRSYLSETAAEQPFNKLKPIVALVNGREYSDEAAEEFADRLECDVMLCGHTPTSHGFTVKNKRHLIVDSQHPKARYVAFDKQQRYETSEALAEELNTLYPDSAEREIEGELL